VLAAGERLQTALEDEGYAFAKVDPPIAHEIRRIGSSMSASTS
jgi:hypothetical protein